LGKKKEELHFANLIEDESKINFFERQSKFGRFFDKDKSEKINFEDLSDDELIKALEIEKRTVQRVLYFFSSSLVLLFLVTIYYPAISHFVTSARIESLFIPSIIYLPLFAVFILMISSIINYPMFSKKVFFWSVLSLIVIMFLDVWFPHTTVTIGGKIVVNSTYRASIDYVIFDVWRRLLGNNIIEYNFSSISLGWILTYFSSATLFVIVVYLLVKIRNKIEEKDGNV